MELEKQNEVYRQTIEALSAQNDRLKKELLEAQGKIAEMEHIVNMPEHGVEQTYQQMLSYCQEAMEYRDEMRRLAQEMALNKAQYQKAIRELVNEML